MKNKGISVTIIILAIIVLLGLIIASGSFKNFVPSTTTTVTKTTTTTIISCSKMDPNYCNTDDDCICSLTKCFRGNKDYAEYCVPDVNACQMSYCPFTPQQRMVCTNHTCQIGTIYTTTTTTTVQCGGWPGALPSPYTLRIGGQKENYTVNETVTLGLYLKNNPRCEGGQLVDREMTLNTLSFSVDVERLITTQIPYTLEPVLLTNVLSQSTGPITIPTSTEIELGQWTWSQTDSQGKQVGDGTYQITLKPLASNFTTSILTFITIESH